MPTTSTRWRDGGRSRRRRPTPVNRVIKRLWEGPPHTVGRVLERGRRGRRLPRRPRPGPRPRRGDLLPRVRPGRHLRGRDPQHELRDRAARDQGAARIFTYDPAENRRSIRKLADLNPSLILPGHGPAVTDIAAFERFVAALLPEGSAAFRRVECYQLLGTAGRWGFPSQPRGTRLTGASPTAGKEPR